MSKYGSSKKSKYVIVDEAKLKLTKKEMANGKERYSKWEKMMKRKFPRMRRDS